MPNEKQEFIDLTGRLPKHRAAFEMQIEAVCLEITHLAKDIASYIGELSIDEVKQVIIDEFTRRVKEPVIIG